MHDKALSRVLFGFFFFFCIQHKQHKAKWWLAPAHRWMGGREGRGCGFAEIKTQGARELKQKKKKYTTGCK